MQIQKPIESTPNTTLPTSGPTPPPSTPSGGLTPNGTFNLWQMLMAIMKYEKTVLDNNATMQKNWAQNLGGENGIYANLYKIGVSVGNYDAESLTKEAIYQFAQAGVSGTSLLATGALALKANSNAALGKAGIEDMNNMEGAIEGSQAGVSLKDTQVEGPLTKEVQEKINDWKQGKIEQFKNPDENQAALNKEAAEAAATHPDKQQVLKKIQKQKKVYENNIRSADQNFNNHVQYLQTATGGINQGLIAGGNIAKAGKLADKGKASAAQTVVSQVQQQVSTQENKAEQNAQDALQQANQWAAAFASAASAQVHA